MNKPHEMPDLGTPSDLGRWFFLSRRVTMRGTE